MVLFAVLMLGIAWLMWHKAEPPVIFDENDDAGPSCRRNPEGKLKLTSRCAVVLLGVGLLTGILSGLFGVGGGFVIVPALVFFTGMGIHRAVATSLLVIVMVSISGVASHSLAGEGISWPVTAMFVVGGVGGLFGSVASGEQTLGAPIAENLRSGNHGAGVVYAVSQLRLIENIPEGKCAFGLKLNIYRQSILQKGHVMKLVIVGAVAGGASAAARARRLDEDAQILLVERGEAPSFANCGLPYYVGGVIEDRNKLLVAPETN